LGEITQSRAISPSVTALTWSETSTLEHDTAALHRDAETGGELAALPRETYVADVVIA